MEFTADPKLDNYCVIGNPVAHSKSPLIHKTFASQFGLDIAYHAFAVPEAGFVDALAGLQRAGFKGLNITVPFKQEAWSRAEVLTERARRAGSVNTLWFSADSKVCGDTTDGIGLVSDLLNHGISLRDKRVLILGAGGAVRGVLFNLHQQGPASLCITNRSRARAEQIRSDFSTFMTLELKAPQELETQVFDVVINGTSASLRGELLPLPDGILAYGASCYDMVYSQADTVFMHWARQQGAACALDGLGMLVEQAAESFRIWTGLTPETGPVMEMLRASYRS